MALIVVDASVLIALLDPADARHAASADALRRHAGDDLQVPASAYAESLVGPARRGRLEPARRAVTALLADIVPLSGHIAEAAAELIGRHPGLRLADALVVATGVVLDADVILTCDAAWRALDPAVEVVGVVQDERGAARPDR
jgi:predicted nucleic acid-binding protein